MLYAGAAVGVSHLVQSTRAGATYGFVLIIAVVLANLVKYPFFEFGPRYATATRKSLLEGYMRIGPWALWLLVLITISTMWIIEGAITAVTSGLAIQLTGLELPVWQWSGILLSVCLLVLGFGRYSLLDRLMKVIILTLTFTTVIALVASFFGHTPSLPEFERAFSFAKKDDIKFLVALIGWMPAPIDIAIWHSVWTVAKMKDYGKKLTLKESLLDFKVGFWGTALLAICFLALGALVMYGTGTVPEGKAGAFAGQIIELYTSSLGGWAYWIIVIAAFTTMFSTTITVLDAFPRVLRRSTQLLFPKAPQDEDNRFLYWFWLLIASVGSFGLLLTFKLIPGLNFSMKNLVDLATTISFLVAPVLAFLNFRAVTSPDVPAEYQPGPRLRLLSWIGIFLLTAFSLYYLYFSFGG